jgi:hypothetical protein
MATHRRRQEAVLRVLRVLHVLHVLHVLQIVGLDDVIATGYAQLITDPREAARCQAVLRPWATETMDRTVRIRPDLVIGLLLAPADGNCSVPTP